MEGILEFEMSSAYPNKRRSDVRLNLLFRTNVLLDTPTVVTALILPPPSAV